jgi:hypothetical protein
MTPTARRRSLLVTTLAVPMLALAAGALVLALPPVPLAWGQSRSGAVTVVNAEVMVLHATRSEGHGAIDPAIGNLPQLREPPLSAYNTYRLLDKRNLALPMGTSVMYPMPNGRVLQVTFVDKAGGHAFHVMTAINQPGASPYLNRLELTAKPNEPFFVGGQMYHGGTILLVITLRP